MDRRTKMDDFKRGIYLAARQGLQADKDAFLCLLLKGEIERLGPGKWLTDGELEEFFPEFFALWDGYWSGATIRVSLGPHDAWWNLDEAGYNARLATLDFLLTRGT